MKNSRSTKPQINRVRSEPNKLNAVAPILSMNQDQYQSFVTVALREQVDEYRSPVKKLAEVAGSSLAAAKHWYSNEATPNGLYMGRLRARFPGFDAKMRELEGRRDDLDPDFPRMLNEVFMRALRTDETLAREVYERFMKPANDGKESAA